MRALARADLLPAGEKNGFSGKESEHVSRSAADAGFDVSLRCLEYKPNHFHMLNCLTLPETQNAAQGTSGLCGRGDTPRVCFLAGVLSCWSSVTAPRRWMLWWVPRATSAPC